MTRTRWSTRSARIGIALSCAACSTDDEPGTTADGRDAAPQAADAATEVDDGSATSPDAGEDGDTAATNPTSVTPAPEGEPYQSLSEWNLFSDFAGQVPMHGVVPFQPISPLFSDYASKHRFLYVPEGETIGYENEAKWRFPVGTILVKTFSILADLRDPTSEERLLETRLLVRESDGWAPHAYVYDDTGTNAERQVAGVTIPVSFVDANGATVTNDYGVPNSFECMDCHGEFPNTDTLGGRTRQLNWELDYGNGPENQIDHLAGLGLFDVAPPASARTTLVDPAGAASVIDRARSYLDSNCGSCHTEDGEMSSGSGLKLVYETTDPTTGTPLDWGVCKVPTSAGDGTCGLSYDVVPGVPDESILLCRLASTEPQIQMAPLGRRLAHTEGVALIREWIASMTGACQ